MHSMMLNRAGRLALTVKGFSAPRHVNCLSTVASPAFQYETLNVTVPKPFVYHVELNRPKNLNSLNRLMWIEIGKCFSELSENNDCRVVVLSATGRLFTAGLDFTDVTEFGNAISEHEDIARKCQVLSRTIKLYQDSITSLEKCPKPVICAVHNACVGAGVDLITAGDIRMCTEDAWFQVKEVDIGMAADVGTLQRLPRVIGSDSLVRELVYTARKLPAAEAKHCGLVSQVFSSKESMVESVLEMAAVIASKSPVAIQGTKRSLVYSRDHSVQEGLDHIHIWNMAMLQSEDFFNAAMAQATKSPPPTFSKL